MKLAVEQAVFTFGDRFNIYNEKGECISKTSLDPNQHINSYSYEYDENGRIKRETYMYTSLYTPNDGSGYDYDNAGNLLGYSLSGEVSVSEYFYSENGKEVKILTTLKYGNNIYNNTSYRTSYKTYDDHNNLIEEKYEYDNYCQVEKYEYTYDSNNNPIEIIWYNPVDSTQCKYEYEYEAIRTNNKKIDQILNDLTRGIVQP